MCLHQTFSSIFTFNNCYKTFLLSYARFFFNFCKILCSFLLHEALCPAGQSDKYSAIRSVIAPKMALTVAGVDSMSKVASNRPRVATETLSPKFLLQFKFVFSARALTLENEVSIN